MTPDSLPFQIAAWLIPLVLAIVLHEIAHGWVANAFGDPTARDLGRLSPNPIRHVDPVGTVALPLILAVSGAPVFGWAKPVPVVAERLRNPRFHMMIVAAAGPAMNLLLALLGTVALAAFLAAGDPASLGGVFLFENLRNFIVVNVFLALFNLLPFPPLDGGHVVQGLLPRRLARGYGRLGRFGLLALILLLVVLPMISPKLNFLPALIGPPARAVLDFLAALVGLA